MFSSCLLAATGGASTNCRAQGQAQAGDVTPPKKGVNGTGTKQQDPTEDSSSEIAERPVKATDYDNSLGPHLFKSIVMTRRRFGRALLASDWSTRIGCCRSGSRPVECWPRTRKSASIFRTRQIS